MAHLKEEGAWSKKRLNEDFNLFRKLVVDLVNEKNKENHRHIFQEVNEMTNPEMKNIANDFFKNYSSAGVFTSKSKFIRESITMMYKISYTAQAGNMFTDRLLNDPSFKNSVRLEANNLNSGSNIYSSVVAAEETKQLRNELYEQYKDIVGLKSANEGMNEKLQRATLSLTNLISNVKNFMGVKEETIKQYTDKHFNELSKDVKEEDLTIAVKIGYFNVKESLGEGDYPDGVGESQLHQTVIFGKNKDLFIVKQETTYNDPDGYSSASQPVYRVTNKEGVEKLIEEFKKSNPDKTAMAANSLTHNLNSFITRKEKEMMNSVIRM